MNSHDISHTHTHIQTGPLLYPRPLVWEGMSLFLRCNYPWGKYKKNAPKVWHGGQKTNLIWPHLFLPHPKHHFIEQKLHGAIFLHLPHEDMDRDRLTARCPGNWQLVPFSFDIYFAEPDNHWLMSLFISICILTGSSYGSWLSMVQT